MDNENKEVTRVRANIVGNHPEKEVAYIQGYNDGYRQAVIGLSDETAKVQDDEVAFNQWQLLIVRIGEAAQVGRGELLKARLYVLSPQLAESATRYCNILTRYTVALSYEEVEKHQNVIREITSIYQDGVNSALKGGNDFNGDQGEAIRAIAQYNLTDDPLFAPFRLKLKRNRGLSQPVLLLGQMVVAAEQLYGRGKSLIVLGQKVMYQLVNKPDLTTEEKIVLDDLKIYFAPDNGNLYLPYEQKEAFRKHISRAKREYENKDRK